MTKNLQKWLTHWDWFRIWCLETLVSHTQDTDKTATAPVHSLISNQLAGQILSFSSLGLPADHKLTCKSH